MARGLNKVMLIGRLGADPEIRYTQDGTPVANLRLATNRAVKKGEQWEEETDWHRVIAWRRLAEICERYLNKGSLIYVEGQIRTRSWEDKDGIKRYVTEIQAQDIQMLDSKKERLGGETEGLETPPPIEDDVPF
ncbi:MAG: single-stranded DNA-binding protein [Dissulfurimicrobium sp.]|uniref:single-stranded DNA-binding protein n=1 Tax=Dissulfurimicrobium TaxID=1769732 RepID=UPI001EDA145A|nr:single-stranded DNA-binding protein [Dissulfurimicrobium hydrothermale]UKL14129.1 single-stranded DNA-binding protein [Dissulfurimicrobium hydrothermale]